MWYGDGGNCALVHLLIDIVKSCNQLHDATSFLDLDFCFSGHISCPDDDGSIWETSFAQDFGIALPC
jgi:hypothetical protein